MSGILSTPFSAYLWSQHAQKQSYGRSFLQGGISGKCSEIMKEVLSS